MFFVINICVISFCCVHAHRFDYEYSQEADGWLKLHRVPATWQDAYLNCYYEGAVLASPENENMKLALTKLNILSNCGIYIGVHATFGKGAYFSVKGTPLSRMPVTWAPDEPDNSNNAEDCLLMLSNGTMADVKCSETFPYFCYISQEQAKKEINACGTMDEEYSLDTRTGSCYKVHRSPLNWTRAFVACAREGGHLAVINSIMEAQIIATLWNNARPHFVAGKYNRDIAFLGFKTIENKFQWMTIHGQTLAAAGYNRWSDGQPDNPGVQNCGAMFRNGLLDDNNCDNTLPFICEKDPASLLSDPFSQ
ncbi:C-type mannose receptor 2-like [Cydia splendana]|uniref:C-type mannose receptor 2-like n=1 Tax=Cydia splendana TaxID=1100963 RepID=UPI00213006C1